MTFRNITDLPQSHRPSAKSPAFRKVTDPPQSHRHSTKSPAFRKVTEVKIPDLSGSVIEFRDLTAPPLSRPASAISGS
ncbi:MAG: hypothetical protein H6728_00350 [Myxococcales bacterium]|nr:hypothetical protein [Myxococcales bacterium]